MPKFHAARQPFYACAIAYCILAGIVFWFKNDAATGLESLYWLAVDIVYLGLALWSGVYFYITAFGDDEADTEFAGVPVSKKAYYVLLMLAAAYRAVDGLIINTSSTGIESTYGKLWLFASLALGVFTFANYLSYTKKRAPVTAESVRPMRKAS